MQNERKGFSVKIYIRKKLTVGMLPLQVYCTNVMGTNGTEMNVRTEGERGGLEGRRESEGQMRVQQLSPKVGKRKREWTGESYGICYAECS